MAWNMSKAKRQALVKLQLRDKKGRWIEMGRSTKWYDSIAGKNMSGTVVGSKGNMAIVALTDNANGSSPLQTVDVSMKNLEMVGEKASLLSPEVQKLVADTVKTLTGKELKQYTARNEAIEKGKAKQAEVNVDETDDSIPEVKGYLDFEDDGADAQDDSGISEPKLDVTASANQIGFSVKATPGSTPPMTQVGNLKVGDKVYPISTGEGLKSIYNKQKSSMFVKVDKFPTNKGTSEPGLGEVTVVKDNAYAVIKMPSGATIAVSHKDYAMKQNPYIDKAILDAVKDEAKSIYNGKDAPEYWTKGLQANADKVSAEGKKFLTEDDFYKPEETYPFIKSAPIDVSKWNKIPGTQGGSNPGGIYTDENGKKFYVKESKSDMHAKNEILADKFYEAAGIETSRLKLADIDGKGKLGTVSEMLDGSTNDFYSKVKSDKEYRENFQEGFAVDAWLANWDVVGLEFDNALSDANGDAIRIDPGGALLYRAMGSPKGNAFGNEVSEWEKMRLGNNPASQVFGSMTEKDLAKAAMRVASITPEEIGQIVDTMDMDEATSKFLKDTLIVRRQDILNKAKIKPEAMPEELETQTAIPEDIVDDTPEDLQTDFADFPAGTLFTDANNSKLMKVGPDAWKSSDNNGIPTSTEPLSDAAASNLAKEFGYSKTEPKYIDSKVEPTYKTVKIAQAIYDKDGKASFIKAGFGKWNMITPENPDGFIVSSMQLTDKLDSQPNQYFADTGDVMNGGALTPQLLNGALNDEEKEALAFDDGLEEYGSDNPAFTGPAGYNPAEFEAVVAYVNDSDVVNNILRGKGGDFGKSALNIAALDQVINKSIVAEPTTVFRGIRMRPDKFDSMKASSMYKDWGYSSTSDDEDKAIEWAGDSAFDDRVPVMLSIELPKGFKAHKVDYESTGLYADYGMESEAILPRNTAIDITSIEEYTTPSGTKGYKAVGTPILNENNYIGDAVDGYNTGDTGGDSAESGDTGDGESTSGQADDGLGQSTDSDSEGSTGDAPEEPSTEGEADQEQLSPAAFLTEGKSAGSFSNPDVQDYLIQLSKNPNFAFPNKGKTVADGDSTFEANSQVVSPKFGKGIVAVVLPSTDSAKVLYADHGYKVTKASNMNLAQAVVKSDAPIDIGNLAPGETGTNPATGKKFIVGKNNVALTHGDSVNYTKKGETKAGTIDGIYAGTKTAKVKWPDGTSATIKASQLVGNKPESAPEAVEAPEAPATPESAVDAPKEPTESETLPLGTTVVTADDVTYTKLYDDEEGWTDDKSGFLYTDSDIQDVIDAGDVEITEPSTEATLEPVVETPDAVVELEQIEAYPVGTKFTENTGKVWTKDAQNNWDSNTAIATDAGMMKRFNANDEWAVELPVETPEVEEDEDGNYEETDADELEEVDSEATQARLDAAPTNATVAVDGKIFVKKFNGNWINTSDPLGDEYGSGANLVSEYEGNEFEFSDVLSHDTDPSEFDELANGSEVYNETFGLTFKKDDDGDWIDIDGQGEYYKDADSLFGAFPSDGWQITVNAPRPEKENNISEYELDMAGMYDELHSSDLEMTFQKNDAGEWSSYDNGNEYSSSALLEEFKAEDWYINESELDENYQYGWQPDEDAPIGTKVSHAESTSDSPSTFIKIAEDNWVELGYNGKPTYNPNVGDDESFQEGYSSFVEEGDGRVDFAPIDFESLNHQEIDPAYATEEYISSLPIGTLIAKVDNPTTMHKKVEDNLWKPQDKYGTPNPYNAGEVDDAKVASSVTQTAHIWLPEDSSTPETEAPNDWDEVLGDVFDSVKVADLPIGTFVPTHGREVATTGFVKTGDNAWSMQVSGQNIGQSVNDDFVQAVYDVNKPAIKAPEAEETAQVDAVSKIVDYSNQDVIDAPVGAKIIPGESDTYWEKVGVDNWAFVNVDGVKNNSFQDSSFVDTGTNGWYIEMPETSAEATAPEPEVAPASSLKLGEMTEDQINALPVGTYINYTEQSYFVKKTGGAWQFDYNKDSTVPDTIKVDNTANDLKTKLNEDSSFVLPENSPEEIQPAPISMADLVKKGFSNLSIAEVDSLPVGTKVVREANNGYALKKPNGNWTEVINDADANVDYDSEKVRYYAQQGYILDEIILPEEPLADWEKELLEGSSPVEEVPEPVSNGSSIKTGYTPSDVVAAPIGSVIKAEPPHVGWTKVAENQWKYNDEEVNGTLFEDVHMVGTPDWTLETTDTKPATSDDLKTIEDVKALPVGTKIEFNTGASMSSGKFDLVKQPSNWKLYWKNGDEHSNTYTNQQILSGVFTKNSQPIVYPEDAAQPTANGAKNLGDMTQEEFNALPVGTKVISYSSPEAFFTKNGDNNWKKTMPSAGEGTTTYFDLELGPGSGWTNQNEPVTLPEGYTTPAPAATADAKTVGQMSATEFAALPIGTTVPRNDGGIFTKKADNHWEVTLNGVEYPDVTYYDNELISGIKFADQTAVPVLPSAPASANAVPVKAGDLTITQISALPEGTKIPIKGKNFDENYLIKGPGILWAKVNLSANYTSANMFTADEIQNGQYDIDNTANIVLPDGAAPIDLTSSAANGAPAAPVTKTKADATVGDINSFPVGTFISDMDGDGWGYKKGDDDNWTQVSSKTADPNPSGNKYDAEGILNHSLINDDAVFELPEGAAPATTTPAEPKTFGQVTIEELDSYPVGTFILDSDDDEAGYKKNNNGKWKAVDYIDITPSENAGLSSTMFKSKYGIAQNAVFVFPENATPAAPEAPVVPTTKISIGDFTDEEVEAFPPGTYFSDKDNDNWSFKKAEDGTWVHLSNPTNQTYNGALTWSSVKNGSLIDNAKEVIFPEGMTPAFALPSEPAPEPYSAKGFTEEQFAAMPLGTELKHDNKSKFVKTADGVWTYTKPSGATDDSITYSNADLNNGNSSYSWVNTGNVMVQEPAPVGTPDFDPIFQPSGTSLSDLSKAEFDALPLNTKVEFALGNSLTGTYEKLSKFFWSYTPKHSDKPQNTNVANEAFAHLFEEDYEFPANVTYTTKNDEEAPADGETETVDNTPQTLFTGLGYSTFTQEVLDAYPTGTTLKPEVNSYYTPSPYYSVKQADGTWTTYKKTAKTLSKKDLVTKPNTGNNGLGYSNTVQMPTAAKFFNTGTGELAYEGDVVNYAGQSYTVKKIFKTGIDLTPATGDLVAKVKPKDITKPGNDQWGKKQADTNNSSGNSANQSPAPITVQAQSIAALKAAEQKLNNFAGIKPEEVTTSIKTAAPYIDVFETLPQTDLDPSNPLYGAPEPQAPEPLEYMAPFDESAPTDLPKWDKNDEWLKKVEQRYLDNPNKAKSKVQESNNWPAIQGVLAGGDEFNSGLTKLLSNKYITQDMYDEAVAKREVNEIENAPLIAQHKADLAEAKAKHEAANAKKIADHATATTKYQDDLKAWSAANPNADAKRFPKWPDFSTTPFEGGEADWDKAPKGTVSLNAAIAAIKKDVPLSNMGISVATDGEKIEDLDVNIKRVIDISGNEVLDYRFKVTSAFSDVLEAKLMGQAGVNTSTMVNLPQFGRDKKTGLLKETPGSMHSAGGKEFTYTDAETGAVVTYQRPSNKTDVMMNAVRIKMPIGSTSAQYQKVLTDLGIDAKPSTDATVRIFAENRFIATMLGNHDGTTNLTGAARTKAFDDIKKKYDITMDDVVLTTNSVGRVKVQLTDVAAEKLAKMTNVQYFHHGLSTHDPDALFNIITGEMGGLLSTYQRWQNGIHTSGQSSSQDVGNNGGDYLFTKVIHNSSSMAHGNAGVKINAKAALKRLDIYGNSGDEFGRFVASSPATYKLMEGHPYEVMFRHGVPVSDWDGIVLSSSAVTNLIARLKKAGILKINGIPVEKFVTTNESQFAGISGDVTATKIVE